MEEVDVRAVISTLNEEFIARIVEELMMKTPDSPLTESE
jgi:hypothetical protein